MLNRIYIIIVISTLAFISCDDLDNLNDNPKSPTDVPSTSLFLAGQKNLADTYSSISWASSPFRVLAQTWTQTSYMNEAQYQFANNNAPGGWWDKIYTTVLANLAESKTLYDNDNSSNTVKNNKKLITDILEVYSYSLLVSTYGDIPYSEALNRKIPFPKYDDAKEVTYDLISRLDTDIAGLDATAGSFGSVDQIYAGNVAQWKKFAATLKLKLALLIADADPTTASTKVKEAITSGVFTSNSDNAKFKYVSGVVANSNPIWQDIVVGTSAVYYAPSALFVNTLNELNDPRLPILFEKNPNGGYSGAIPGQGGTNQELSKFSNFWLSASSPSVLLDYSETLFLLAEAVERNIVSAKSAEIYYNEAITASISDLGATIDQANSYLTQSKVAYTTAAGDWRQKIGTQKWLAFANRNWDSWTEIRRLGHPNLDVLSPPVNAISKLPVRFYYPPKEQNSNSVHWKEAVSKLTGGEDIVSAKLFWQR